MNAEDEPAEDLRGAFDFAIATNVVHAISDTALVLRNIKQMFKPTGSVILSELTMCLPFYDLIYGLLDGWWSFSDGRDYALQGPRYWVSTMRTAGFTDIRYTEGTVPEADMQKLIVGKADTATDGESSHFFFPRLNSKTVKETVVFKEIDECKIRADVFYPKKPLHQKYSVGKSAEVLFSRVIAYSLSADGTRRWPHDVVTYCCASSPELLPSREWVYSSFN